MNLIFKISDVDRCVKHALSGEKWGMGYEDIEPAPGLLLVHDNGVYLMSNANPGDFIPEKDRCYVSYAAGCNPDCDENFYEISRELVGGDDFVEFIPINENWLSMMANYDEIHVDITPEEISVSFAIAQEV